MYEEKTSQELVKMAEEYLQFNQAEKTLEIARVLMNRNYPYVHRVYCKYLLNTNRVNDAIRFLEGREKTVREKIWKVADQEQLKLLDSIRMAKEECLVHKYLGLSNKEECYIEA